MTTAPPPIMRNAAPPAHVNRPLLRGLAGAGVVLAAAVLLIAFQALHLWRYPLWVPFSYHESDVVVMLMYIKGVVQDGWPTTISQLSAPFAYSGAAFPMQTSFDWLLIKLLSLKTHEPGLLLNAFWLSTLVMGAWTAAYAAWQMRVSAVLACAGGILYAFLPFALLRFTHHLNLVYYLVPLVCLLAVLIAAGPEALRNPRQARNVGLAACVAQGFGYAYFSFFAVVLFGFAALIGLRRAGLRQLRLPVLACALVTAATVLNLAPSLRSWEREGTPPEMEYKKAAEAEVYGAKLRAMVRPHDANPVPLLAQWAAADRAAGFPLENENGTARLGLFGAAGLLLLLLLRLRRTQPDPALDAASALGLAVFLTITVGGLGALVNVLTVPDIRGYNRFSVHLGFFAIVSLLLWAPARLPAPLRWPRLAGLAALLAFAALSLADQLLDRRQFVYHQPDAIQRAFADRAAVENLERILPERAAVLQLPLTGYPSISVMGAMQSYDHGRAYLWSHDLRWSWPSFSQQHRAWQDRLAALQGPAVVEMAVLSGFDAIWIDRSAYADKGEALRAGFEQAGARRLDIGNDHILALDLRAVRDWLRATLGQAEFERRSRALLAPRALVKWQSGFYSEEHAGDGKPFHWAGKEAAMALRNPATVPMDVCATFEIQAPMGGPVRLDDGARTLPLGAGGAVQAVRLPLRLAPGENRVLRLSAQGGPMQVPNETRALYFYVKSFDVRTLEPNERRDCGMQ